MCVGSHGDMRPYIALGVGLKQKGYQVTIASHHKAQKLCQQYDLEFKLVEGDLVELLGTEKGSALTNHVGGHNFKQLWEMIKAFKEVLKLQLATSLDAVRDTEVMIYGPAVFAGPHLGEALDIPSFRVMMQPEIRTKEHSSMIFPNQRWFGKIGNYAGHVLAEQLFWLPIRKQINEWRVNTLGLRKMTFLGPSFDPISQQIPTLVAFSSKLLPQPSDWPTQVKMTNFCRLPEGQLWEAPRPLDEFLQDGPPPFYLGFGSLTEACPRWIVPQIVDVLAEKKVRVVIHSQLPGLEALILPHDVFPLRYAPHDWLFPRMKAVVHHGGAGTTAAGLYAGKPTLIIPFMCDQFQWNNRIAELNIGPRGFPIREFTQQRFSDCLDALLSTPLYHENAIKMSKEMHDEEDGVAMTIREIEKYILK